MIIVPEKEIAGLIDRKASFDAVEKVIGWNHRPENIHVLENTAKELGLPFEAVSLETLGAEADVIITIASSFAPMLLDRHISDGTHIACMGTDTIGKQEVEATLVARTTLFTDEIVQATTLGECQHAIKDGLITPDAITEIGHVINGTHKGRTSPDEVTLFDGTGVGLQDLAIAATAVELAKAKGVAIEVDI